MENELDEVDMSGSTYQGSIYESRSRKNDCLLEVRDSESLKQIDNSMFRAHQETIYIQPWIFTAEAHSIIWEKKKIILINCCCHHCWRKDLACVLIQEVWSKEVSGNGKCTYICQGYVRWKEI